MRPSFAMALLCASLFTLGSAVRADDTAPVRLGVSVALHTSTFIGNSQSGPWTPVSDTLYSDTFEHGRGGRLEIFRDLDSTWRLQGGVARTGWSGRYFKGGEFPAGVQFGDFGATAFYGGARWRFREGNTVRPYFVGNFGLTWLDDVAVDTGSGPSPYWKRTLRDYLELGAGVEVRLSDRTALLFDGRFQVFGKPGSARGYTAEGTGGVAFLISAGFDFNLR